MKVSDFDYQLPPELIAKEPLADRSGSRMLVLDRRTKTWQDRQFRDLPEFLQPGDCLVVNDSRVLPARLFGIRVGTGAAVEILLLRHLDPEFRRWRTLVRPGKKLLVGAKIDFGQNLTAEIVEHGEHGERLVEFSTSGSILAAIETIGHMPLPPYLKRPDTAEDRERYQTVFARETGSAAAPTAGLHFTPEVLDRCRAVGADFAQVTLHVGLGTFQTFHVEHIADAKLHSEAYSISSSAAAKINAAKRVFAIGTTSVRTLETAAQTTCPTCPEVAESQGDTSIFIYPGFRFKVVDSLLTNFHLPQSSLLMLVSAFCGQLDPSLDGREFALAAYHHAVEQRYRFFSYGDCMLIL
jgi:S-adenosylmethionine:tRNA ribosyltransferase-isomerase